MLAWMASADTVVDGNTFINCARGVALSLEDRAGSTDHSSGVIRNNVVFRARRQPGDVGISVNDSPGTQVLNDTVVLSGTYGASIEYRFTSSGSVVLTNNLVDGTVARRDGATGTETKTLRASAAMFVNVAAGDLHLAAGAGAIDAGDNLALVTTDVDGDARPQGAATDIGADEYRASIGLRRFGQLPLHRPLARRIRHRVVTP